MESLGASLIEDYSIKPDDGIGRVLRLRLEDQAVKYCSLHNVATLSFGSSFFGDFDA